MKKLGIRISLAFVLVAVLTIGLVSPVGAKPIRTVTIANEGYNSTHVYFNYEWSNWGAWGVECTLYQMEEFTYDIITTTDRETIMNDPLKRLTSYNSTPSGLTSLEHGGYGYDYRIVVWLVKKNANHVRLALDVVDVHIPV